MLRSTNFDEMDLDGDGMVDYNEFLTGLINKKKYITTDNLNRVFDLFDRD